MWAQRGSRSGGNWHLWWYCGSVLESFVCDGWNVRVGWPGAVCASGTSHHSRPPARTAQASPPDAKTAVTAQISHALAAVLPTAPSYAQASFIQAFIFIGAHSWPREYPGFLQDIIGHIQVRCAQR